MYLLNVAVYNSYNSLVQYIELTCPVASWEIVSNTKNDNASTSFIFASTVASMTKTPSSEPYDIAS